MNPETFFDKFGLLVDTPNGVQKLRELILQLALQGKLVPQDPNDEPAAVLLGKIKATNKKTKKSFPIITKNDNFYELPKLWEWVRLGDILTLEYGKNLPKSKRNQYGEYPVYGSNGIVGYHDDFLIDEPAIIVGRKGSAGALNISSEPSWPTDVSYYLIPPDSINLNFAFILLKSLKLETLGKGIKPGVNRNEAYQLITSLPPLNEQKRIVAKVDNLMTLCDELEARQQKKQEARLRLNSAALDKLLTAHEPDEFAHHWQRICDNFDLLYDETENVGELRKAILQLAVHGKLVRQDSNDEPAAVLLEKIKAEKERLIKEKKIRKLKPLSPINKNDFPHEIPKTWNWVRLVDVFDVRDGTHDSPKYLPNGIPLVTSKNLSNGYLDLTNVKFISEEDHLKISERSGVDKHDILFAMIGSIGNPIVVDTLLEFSIKNVALFKYYVLKLSVPSYLHYFLIHASHNMRKQAAGGVQSFVSLGYLRNYLIPLPPLQEQRRIAAKVDQLMALCDDLESKLKQSQTDGEKLMAAVVAELTGA